MILAFFASSDAIVNDNLVENFYQEITYPEARSFYAFQICIEGIHSEMYSLLIDTYVDNPTEKAALFNAVNTVKSVEQKAAWCEKWTLRDNATFPERLVAFAVVEGVFFSSSFCAIFWLKKRGLLPGLCFSNELISRDEGMHCDFACLLYNNHVVNKLPQMRIHEIVREAVEAENAFVEESLSQPLLGMNSELMNQYVRFCADRLLMALHTEPIYNTTNPFDWMEMISLQGKTNFFEKRVGEYSKAGVGVDLAQQVFSTTMDF
jgi:ribonucleotide reductase beta subunit family protein with ferritin-like domain